MIWWEVEHNNIYVGLNEFDENSKQLISVIAFRGHRKIHRGAHAWGIAGAKKGWRPGDSPQAVIERTARYGKVEQK